LSTDTTLRHLTMLNQLPTYPAQGITAKAIHKNLIDDGFTVSKRTIERDLRKLECALKIESHDNEGQLLWYQLPQQKKVPSAAGPFDALMMVLSHQTLKYTLPESIHWKVNENLEKAKMVLSNYQKVSKLEQKVHVISDGYPLLVNEFNEPWGNTAIREAIYLSVIEESQLSITYSYAHYATPLKMELNPLGIIVRGQTHYLVASHTNNPEEPHLFLLHRIKSVKMGFMNIVVPKTFSLASYFATNPSGYVLKDEPVTVTLKVKGYASDVLMRHALGKGQSIKKLGEQWCEVTFTTVPTYDLIAWILRYGADVECIQPDFLRAKIKKALQKTLSLYTTES
jgi:predicted DNA-binding transcriptional regulator YafY